MSASNLSYSTYFLEMLSLLQALRDLKTLQELQASNYIRSDSNPIATSLSIGCPYRPPAIPHRFPYHFDVPRRAMVSPAPFFALLHRVSVRKRPRTITGSQPVSEPAAFCLRKPRSFPFSPVIPASTMFHESVANMACSPIVET